MVKTVDTPSRGFILGSFILIMAVHTVATLRYWYWVYPWFDIPMHFAGGILAAMLFLRIFNDAGLIEKVENSEPAKRGILKSKEMIILVVLLGFVALVGVLWELFEFLLDISLKRASVHLPSQVGLSDTMKDLANDLLGGFAVFFAFLKRVKT